MADFHDPVRHAESLSQAYAQDKRPLGLFLSAGCPFSIKDVEAGTPLLPDIAGLTAAVARNLPKVEADAFTLASNKLVEDGIAAPNIEDVLSFIRSLHEVVGAGVVRDFTKAQLETLDAGISESIAALVDVSLPSQMTPFDRIAKWVGSTSRSYPVELFTTNYDLLIERAFERRHVPFFDGFVGTERAFFDQRSIEEDECPTRWARIWKLHGSINWHLDAEGNTIRSTVQDSTARRLIHPSHLKYVASRRLPYLAMIDRMRAFLKLNTAVLLVCGYSFRDEHLNEVLLQGAESNPSTAIFAAQFGNLNDYPSAIKIATSCQNFNVLARDAAIIGGVRAPWKSPQDVLDTDRLSTFWEREGAEEGAEVGSGRFLLGDFERLGKFLSLLVSSTDVD